MDKETVVAIGTIVLIVIAGIELLGYGDDIRDWTFGKDKPSSQFEIEHKSIISRNGYPTLVLNYPLLDEGVKFRIYTLDGKEIDNSYKEAQTTEVSLKMTNKQWETPENKYRLKVTDANNQENILYNEVLSFEPPNIRIEKVELGWEENQYGFELTELWVNISNAGELPVYLNPWYADAEIILENNGGLPKEDIITDFSEEGTSLLGNKKLQVNFDHPIFTVSEKGKYYFQLTLKNQSGEIASKRGEFEVD